jgi:hypothetical protein
VARPTPTPTPAAKARTQVDVLAELEKIRKQALKPPAGAHPAVTAAATVSGAHAQVPATPTRPVGNGRGEIHRSIELTLKRADFKRARRFSVSLKVEDGDNKIVDAIGDLQVELQDLSNLEKVLLHLNIALNAKE